MGNNYSLFREKVRALRPLVENFQNRVRNLIPALLAIGFTVEVAAAAALASAPLAITFVGLAGGLIADAVKRNARDRANIPIQTELEPLLRTT